MRVFFCCCVAAAITSTNTASEEKVVEPSPSAPAQATDATPSATAVANEPESTPSQDAAASTITANTNTDAAPVDAPASEQQPQQQPATLEVTAAPAASAAGNATADAAAIAAANAAAAAETAAHVDALRTHMDDVEKSASDARVALTLQQNTLRLASALLEQKPVAAELDEMRTAALALDLVLVVAAIERVARSEPTRPVLSTVALRALLSGVEVSAQRIDARRIAVNTPGVGAFPRFVVDAYAAVVRGATVWPGVCLSVRR